MEQGQRFLFISLIFNKLKINNSIAVALSFCISSLLLKVFYAKKKLI